VLFLVVEILILALQDFLVMMAAKKPTKPKAAG
jgi:hypothetical protein